MSAEMDIQTNHPWAEYERRKAELLRACDTPEEYETEIRKLLEDLGL